MTAERHEDLRHGREPAAGGVSPPPALEWVGVGLRLGAFALVDVSLRVERRAWVAIVGPTGAGKTLLLETAAGFAAPSSGAIHRDGVDVTQAPPEARRLGYAPQDDLLFPHLDVRRNLLFGARRAGRAPAALEGEMLRVAGDLGIAPILDRGVRGLSGGESQRVSVARALLSGAGLLLLDECTSALDDGTRRTVGDALARWRREHDATIVQVTHDRAEAERLADVVVHVEAGRLTHRVVPGGRHTRAAVRPLPRERIERRRRGT